MIASDESCGGCDNTAATSGNINAHASAIASFLNAGGGIVAFAGGENAHYYDFLRKPRLRSVGRRRRATAKQVSALLSAFLP